MALETPAGFVLVRTAKVLTTAGEVRRDLSRDDTAHCHTNIQLVNSEDRATQERNEAHLAWGLSYKGLHTYP